MKTVWKKELGSLRPHDPVAEGWLQKIQNGDLVMVEAKKPRNVLHHRKLFALLNIAVDNWPQETTVNALLGAIKIAAGHCDVIQTENGEWKIPKSINFESMDQTEFNPFYDRAVEIVSRVLGVDVETLNAEVRAA